MALNVETMQVVLTAHSNEYIRQMDLAAKATQDLEMRIRRAMTAIKGMSGKFAPDLDTNGFGQSVTELQVQKERLTKQLAELDGEIDWYNRQIFGNPKSGNVSFWKNAANDLGATAEKVQAQLDAVNKKIAGSDKPVKEKESPFERIEAQIQKATNAMTAFQTKLTTSNATLKEMAAYATTIAEKLARSKIPSSMKTGATATGETSSKMNQVAVAAKKADTATKSLNKNLSKSGKSFSSSGMLSMFGRFFKMMIVFRGIFYVMASFGRVLQDAAKQDKTVADDLDRMKSAFTSIAAAIVVIALPLLHALVPSLETAAHAILDIGNAIAASIATLLGQDSYLKASYAQDKWGDNGVKNVNKIKRSILGFDELNVLNGKNAGGGGSGADSSGVMFERVAIEAAEASPFVLKLQRIYQNIRDIIDGIINLLNRPFSTAGTPLERIGATIGLAFDNAFTTLEGITDMLAGLFTGDTERTARGFKTFLDGMFEPAIYDMTFFERQLYKLFNPGSYYFTQIITFAQTVRNTFSTVVDSVKLLFGGLRISWGQVLKGDFSGAWETLKKSFDDAFKNLLVGLRKSFLNFMNLIGLGKVADKVWDALIKGLEGNLNSVVNAINKAIGLINKLLGTSIRGLGTVNLASALSYSRSSIHESEKGAVKGGGGISFSAYASGTVVEPNRPHLALFGDNTSEREVVSPLSTMKQAVVEAMSGMNMSPTFVVQVGNDRLGVATRKALNFSALQSGAIPVNV